MALILPLIAQLGGATRLSELLLLRLLPARRFQNPATLVRIRRAAIRFAVTQVHFESGCFSVIASASFLAAGNLFVFL